MGEPIGPNAGRLVLLVDDDVETRQQVRRLLELRGMEVIQASNGLAALELIQRLPSSFRLVLTELDLPGIPGAVLAETLRLFRPDLPVLCMSGRRVTAGASSKACLSKPLRSDEVEAALEAALADPRSGWEPPEIEGIPESVTTRVQAQFAAAGELVEAALELARGATGGS
jgi:DNA-binding response OmpR family regulator